MRDESIRYCEIDCISLYQVIIKFNELIFELFNINMYLPENSKGTKVYAYDVNSLYPFVMKEYDMPIDKPTLFEGDIRAIDKDAFGFFFCNIKAPDNLKHPIIQTHIKTDNGLRSVAPLGQ